METYKAITKTRNGAYSITRMDYRGLAKLVKCYTDAAKSPFDTMLQTLGVNFSQISSLKILQEQTNRVILQY